MELNNKKLQILIERAWSLYGTLNDEIENGISFCRFCSDHGRYCDIGKTPFDQRKRMIAVRDSLKEVENTLLYLQKLRSRQLTDKHSALSRLEQSRFFLIKQVRQYEGRPLDVVKELSLCFGNENETAFDKNLKETMKNNEGQSRIRRLQSFLICCIRILFGPRNWQNVAGIAVKLILISASLTSTIQFYQAKQQSHSSNSQRRMVSVMHSKEAEKLDTLSTISKMPLDVFCGRG